MLARFFDWLVRKPRSQPATPSTEVVVEAREFPDIPTELAAQLERIEPSRDGQVYYRPCRAHLRDGRVLDCVYFVDAQQYISIWGVWPTDDVHKRSVDVSEIVRVDESPNRLPVAMANQLYFEGESGMGYTVFVLEFKDGTRQACLSGNAVDFVAYPPGKSAADVRAVHPHKGRNSRHVHGPPYHWCLYGPGDPRKRLPPIPLR